MLQIVSFEECRNQWSVSRPLLGLILLQEAYYQDRLRVQLIASLPVSKQTEFAKCLDKLMDGIERNVSIKNKDK